MSERIVEHDGVRLAVQDDGEGTAVVLLHGLTATRRYVVMGSKALERSGHRVIAYDARGHGRSSPARTADDYGYETLAGDLGAVLDACGVESAVLAGASMGAHTLLRFALDQPDRVRGIVAITPAYDPDTNDDPDRLGRWDLLSSGLREGGIDGFVAEYRVEDEVPEAWRETVTTVLRQRMAQHETLGAVADALHVVPRSRPFEALRDLGALDGIPAVVVVSRDEADPSHPFATGEAYALSIPGARRVTEEPGRSPIAWQGGQLSRVIAELASTTSSERV